jgi:hypothetical protein
MKEELVVFETAKLAKEKGFNLKCYHRVSFIWQDKPTHYLGNYLDTNSENIDGMYSAPTQSLLQRWLREIHNIDVFINRDGMFKKESYCIFIHDNIKDISRLRPLDNDVFSGYSTYEEALEKGLQEALKLI